MRFRAWPLMRSIASARLRTCRATGISFQPELYMSQTNSLVSHRRSAYQRQKGRCFYCHAPMWQYDPKIIVRRYGLSPGQVAMLKCTAEHLIARSEGGGDASHNIVAACLCCNQRRHRMRPPPSPDAYLEHVRKRLDAKRWWPLKFHTRFAAQA